MSGYYEGTRHRFIAVTTTGQVESYDTENPESVEAVAWVAERTEKGIPVQSFRSYWREEILPYSFVNAQYKP